MVRRRADREGDERVLLAAWLEGDQAAGAELFERHYKGIAQFFHNKVSESAKDDLINDTFLACLTSLSRFRGQASFKTFLFAIAKNLLKQHIQRVKVGLARQGVDTDIDETPDNSPDWSPVDTAVQHEERQVLLKALRRIPWNHQLALKLYYWDDLTAAEIGDMLRVPLPTIKTRLRDGREYLKEHLHELSTSPEVLRSTTDNVQRRTQRARAHGPDPPAGSREDDLPGTAPRPAPVPDPEPTLDSGPDPEPDPDPELDSGPGPPPGPDPDPDET